MATLDELIGGGDGPVLPKTAMLIADYARARGVSRQAVEKQIKARGIPLLGESPKIVDRAVADRLWPVVDLPEPDGDDDDAADDEVDDDDAGASESLAAARARRESAMADLAEFKRDEEAGRLIDAGAVRHAWVTLVRRFCAGLDALPDRLSEVLAATDDSVEVRTILEREIRLLRTQLADDPPDPRAGLK